MATGEEKKRELWLMFLCGPRYRTHNQMTGWAGDFLLQWQLGCELVPFVFPHVQKLMAAREASGSVNVLKLWAGLYLLIWLAFIQFFVAVFSEPSGVLYLHFVVGLAVFVLAIVNYRGLARTSAPNRVKRISKVIPGMAAVEGLLGFPLYLFKEGIIDWTVNVLHLAVALAIIAQAASTATSYDMWEEKEFK